MYACLTPAHTRPKQIYMTIISKIKFISREYIKVNNAIMYTCLTPAHTRPKQIYMTLLSETYKLNMSKVPKSYCLYL